MQDSLEETLGPLRPPSQPWFPDVTISDQLPPVSQLDSLSNFKLESEIQWPTYLNRPTPGIISTNKWIKLHLELKNQDGSPLKWAPNLRVAIGLVKDNLVDKFEDPFEPKSDAEVRFVGSCSKQTAVVKLKQLYKSFNWQGSRFRFCFYGQDTLLGYSESFESKVKQERPPKKPVCDADAAGAATTNLGKTAVSAVELDVEDESGMCIKSSDNPNTILKELAAALDTIKELKEENNALKKQNCDLKADNERLNALVPTRATRVTQKRKRAA